MKKKTSKFVPLAAAGRRFSSPKVSELLWEELKIFSKLLLRGRNQHRRDKSYQMLTRVSKDLKHYQRANITEDVRKLSKQIMSESNKEWKSLRMKLLSCIRFTAHLLNFLEITFIEVEKQLRMSLFVPMNLLMVSSLSRMWYLLHHHSLCLAKLHSELIGDNNTADMDTSIDVGRVISRISAISPNPALQHFNERTAKNPDQKDSPSTDSHPTAITSSDFRAVPSQVTYKRSNKRRKGVFLMPKMVGKRTIWIRMNSARHKFLTMAVSHVKVLSVRRKSIYDRDYVLSKGIVMLNLGGVKCRSNPGVTSLTKDKITRKKRSFRIVQRKFMKELEVAAADSKPHAFSTHDNRESETTCNIIDELFHNVTY